MSLEIASQEVKLLLSCIQPQASPDSINRHIKADLDWSYLTQLAADNHVLPIFQNRLISLGENAVPLPIQEQLRLLVHSSLRYSLALIHELLELLNLFNSHNIPAIPIKGPALAAYAYGNPLLREFGDLDILVRQRDALQVKELMIEENYIWRAFRSQENTKYNPLKSQARYDFHFVKWHTERHRSCVEIHWETTPKHIMFPLSPAHLWKNLEHIPLMHQDVPMIPATDLLPILCINHAKDHWRTLKTVCDIAHLIAIGQSAKDQAIDWDRSIAHAETLRRKRTLLLGCHLAHQLLDSSIPEKILKLIQADAAIQPMAQQIVKRLSGQSVPLTIWQRLQYNLSLREHWQDKVRYVIFRPQKVNDAEVALAS